MRRSFATLSCAVALLSCGGCKHFFEERTITAFMTALEAEDMLALRQSASGNFDQKALRTADALDDLKILRLPNGKPSIVAVEETSETHKRVTVEVGESQRKLLYELTKDEATGKWVVDDIFVRQKRKGVTATRSVTEQMDLLLTLRELLSDWEDGDRTKILALAVPEFRETLDRLPQPFLAQLASQVATEDRKKRSSAGPVAQLDDDVAYVTLPRSAGQLVVSFRLHEGDWRVSDIAVESKEDGEHIPSIRKYATALATGLEFIAAYNAEDRGRLSELCTTKFHRGTLAESDLKSVPIPSPEPGSTAEKALKLHSAGADLVFPSPRGLVKVGLIREGAGEEDTETTAFRVEDVTFYEADTQQEARLSAWFNAHAAATLFAEAVAARDLASLRHLSSQDLNRRVWSQMDDRQPADVALCGLDAAPPRVISTDFRGSVTEVTVAQGNMAVTYVLHDHGGALTVDDVLAPIAGRPGSLKTSMQAIVPARTFARLMTEVAAIQSESLLGPKLTELERSTSDDFDRLVWRQRANSLPPATFAALPYLQMLPTRVDVTESGTAVVRLGDERRGAAIELVDENRTWVVQDALLVDGPLPNQRQSLKQTMRAELAEGTRRRRTNEPFAAKSDPRPLATVPYGAATAEVAPIASPSAAPPATPRFTRAMPGFPGDAPIENHAAPGRAPFVSRPVRLGSDEPLPTELGDVPLE